MLRRSLLGLVGGLALPAAAGAADLGVGDLVRYSVVKGAQFADKADEKWERFSDSLRDKNACDEATGRRLFDNGFRKDGSRIGNPVLGSLCKPQPLLPLSESMADNVVECIERAAAATLGLSRDQLRANAEAAPPFARARRLSAFEKSLDVAPTFEGGNSAGNKNSAEDQVEARRRYNDRVYRALAVASKAASSRAAAEAFEAAWGKLLLEELARESSSADFRSPFPPPDLDEERAYDDETLRAALGALSKALGALEIG